MCVCHLGELEGEFRRVLARAQLIFCLGRLQNKGQDQKGEGGMQWIVLNFLSCCLMWAWDPMDPLVGGVP